MYKKIIIVIILISNLVNSQVRFGVKGGLNRSAVEDVHNPSDPRTGLSIGALAILPIGYDDQFYVQGELLYSQSGEETKPYKAYVDYISLPILFKAYFSDAESEFFAEIGPQFSFAVSSNITIPEDMKIVNDGNAFGDQTIYSKFDLAMSLGLGYSYRRKLEGGFRYNYGLSDSYPEFKDLKTNRIGLGTIYINYTFD